MVIAGTTGEFIAMGIEERLRVFQLVKDVVRGRVPAIFGSGHFSTKLTIKLSEEAHKRGADALIVILSYYQRPQKSRGHGTLSPGPEGRRSAADALQQPSKLCLPGTHSIRIRLVDEGVL